MKRCSKCGVVKPESEFNRRARNERGLRSQCKQCASKYTKERYSNPILKERRHRKQRQYTANNRYKIKVKRLIKKYGITLLEYTEKLNLQDGCCAICGTKLYGDKTTHLDHDHITGKLRGILCWNCNGGLGNFMDDTERLKAAIVYLEKWKEVKA